MKPFRILHTIRQGHIGGGETHVQELVRHLDKELFESYVLAFGEGSMHDKLHDLGVPSFIIPTSRPFDLRIKNQVIDLAAEIQPDLIHAHGARACSNSYFLADKFEIPLIYTIHGWTFRANMNFIRKWFRKRTEKFLANKSNLVINVSWNDHLTGKEQLGLSNTIEIPNGVDPHLFNGMGNSSQKTEFGFDTNDFVICMIARITQQKDPFTFVRAMDHLKDNKNIKALIVGDGDLLTSVKVLAHKLHLDHKIKFVGSRNDIANILSWTDIYCLPSLWEGLPIGILEAMASGCAVIASNVIGTREVISSHTGILFESGDYDGLSKAIVLLYEKPEFKLSIEKNAIEHIRKHFTIQRMASRVSSQYTTLLKKKENVV